MVQRHLTPQFTRILVLGAMLVVPAVSAGQQRAADGVTINDEGQPQVLDILALRDRPGDGAVRRGGDDAGPVRGTGGAARARWCRRRVHAGVDDGGVRTARTRSDREGR